MGSHSVGILVFHPIQIRETAQKCACFDRLPRPVSTSNDCVPADVIAVVDHLSSLAGNAQAIKEWTAKDPVLSCVHRFTLSGWPTDELSVLDGCLLWASRVIVPPQGRQPLLEELHNTHLGASKMKALAHSYI